MRPLQRTSLSLDRCRPRARARPILYGVSLWTLLLEATSFIANLIAVLNSNCIQTMVHRFQDPSMFPSCSLETCIRSGWAEDDELVLLRMEDSDGSTREHKCKARKAGSFTYTTCGWERGSTPSGSSERILKSFGTLKATEEAALHSSA